MNIKQYFSNLLDRILDFFGLQRKPKIDLTQTGFTETFKIKPVEETTEVEEKDSVRTAIDAYEKPSKEWMDKYQYLLEYDGNDSNYNKLYKTRKWSNPTNSPLMVDFDKVDTHNSDETNADKPNMKELLNSEQYESRLALRKNDDNWLNSKRRKILTSKVIGSDKKFTKKEDKVEEPKTTFLTEKELKERFGDKETGFEIDKSSRASYGLPKVVTEAIRKASIEESIKDLPIEELPKKDKSNG